MSKHPVVCQLPIALLVVVFTGTALAEEAQNEIKTTDETDLIAQGYRIPSVMFSFGGGLGVMGHSIDSGSYDPQFKKDFKNEYQIASWALDGTFRYFFRRVSSATFGTGFGLGYGYFDGIHTIDCELNFMAVRGKNTFRYTLDIPIALDMKVDSLGDDRDYEDSDGRSVSYSPLGLNIGFGIDFCFERLLTKWFSAGIGIKGFLETTTISTNASSTRSSGYTTTTTISINEESQRHWFPGMMLYASVSLRAPRKNFH